jgi:ABC-type bacteriocin/lantibiotic exporter with double-glycine peptidase domain
MKSGTPSVEIVASSGILLGLMSTFSSYFNILIEYYINFTKEFVHIEKLWDTFDNLPQIPNYQQGHSFLFKKGNFDIKNLNFSYNNSAEVLTDFSLNIQG